MSQLLLFIAKEKKRILVSTSPHVLAETLFSLTVTLSHHSLGRTLKNDQSPLWPLDYAYNSLYKTISLWDLNSVPYRRETISTLIYSSSFTVELYWLRKCKVYVCLTFNAHVGFFFKKKTTLCSCSSAYLSFWNYPKKRPLPPCSLSFISQCLFISHLVSITAPTACLNKSLTIWCCWGYSTSGLQDLLSWAK